MPGYHQLAHDDQQLLAKGWLQEDFRAPYRWKSCAGSKLNEKTTDQHDLAL